MGFMAVVGDGGISWMDCTGAQCNIFHLLTAGVQKIAGGRAGDFRLDRGQNLEKNTPVNALFAGKRLCRVCS